MQGVLTAAQHRHVLSTVEKGIAGGAIAHAVPFQSGKARDARHRPGCARGQNNSVRRVIFVRSFYCEFICIGQAHRFGRDELHAQTSGVFNAAALQLRTGNGLGKAVVVFNFFGAVKGTGAFGEHRGVHTGADSVQRSGNARRAGTDDYDIGHLLLLCRLNDLELSPLRSDNISGKIIYNFVNWKNLRISPIYFFTGWGRSG